MAIQEMQLVTENKRRPPALKKIVVGHDFSDAADHAFADATTLARRFGAEIIAAHAIKMNADSSACWSQGGTDRQARAAMEHLMKSVTLAGYPCRYIVRSGTAAATLNDIVDEENADLLLVGAYGNGSKERATLGSTAELLLRSIPCPVLSYGPKFIRPLFQREGVLSVPGSHRTAM